MQTNNSNGSSNNIITRLFASFTDLETAIHSAKATLGMRDGVPEAVLIRLASYDDILLKQRKMAVTLCEQMNKGNWDEVNRLVGIINGLSAMIRDDARAILSSLSLNSDAPAEEQDLNYC
jgi:hypothetical protein